MVGPSNEEVVNCPVDSERGVPRPDCKRRTFFNKSLHLQLPEKFCDKRDLDSRGGRSYVYRTRHPDKVIVQGSDYGSEKAVLD